MVDPSLLKKILELRRRGYTIKEIAKRVGLSYGYVWRLLKRYGDGSNRGSVNHDGSENNSNKGRSQNIYNNDDIARAALLEETKALLLRLRTLEQSLRNISVKDSLDMAIMRYEIEYVALMRVMGKGSKCKYVNKNGYCTKIALAYCPPDLKCKKTKLRKSGIEVYRVRVSEKTLICYICPYYKAKRPIYHF